MLEYKYRENSYYLIRSTEAYFSRLFLPEISNIESLIIDGVEAEINKTTGNDGEHEEPLWAIALG